MIRITKGVSNTIIVTLTEKVTLPAPVYLFRFVSDVGLNESACIMPDLSSYSDRYNKFELIEGTTVTLNDKGFYHYYVYEQTSTTNLDYTLSGTLLECGKANITDNTQSDPTVSFGESDQYVYHP